MSKQNKDEIASLLGPEGPFAREVPGFMPRAGQQEMARQVAAAIDERETLVAEAGTGTGKTFAYLVPALESGKRVIISTGTKTLQDQLYSRDLPSVKKILDARITTRLLKGRANYLCLHRLEQTVHEGNLTDHEQVKELAAIRDWSTRTEHGDRVEVTDVPEDAAIWPRVTSTAENCLGSGCPFYDDCYVVKARREALEADVVVVNHHLFFADLALKQDGFGELLPSADAFILDEAHQVPGLAGQFFSQQASARQLTDLGRDALAECAEVSGALDVLREPVDAINAAVKRLCLALDTVPERGAFAALSYKQTVRLELDHLDEVLEALVTALAAQAERSRGLANVHERAENLSLRLRHIDGSPQDEEVRWYEVTARGFVLHATPLDLSSSLDAMRRNTDAAWVYTSATLAVAGKFEHFTRQLGLDEPRTLALDSPFDFDQQTLCYQPPALPAPNNQAHTEALIEAMRPVLAASEGRAFLLFTSHRALQQAAELLAEQDQWPLFVQGQAPRHKLLGQFRASGNGILLGASSFWQGVDVAGEALSVVMIDKLPFATPDDPVLQARLKALEEAGENPFMAWQVPKAVIELKQGAGRLIRGIHDRGVLVLGDPRLTSKGYGGLFLKSLPPMPRTHAIDDVRAFFATDSATMVE